MKFRSCADSGFASNDVTGKNIRGYIWASYQSHSKITEIIVRQFNEVCLKYDFVTFANTNENSKPRYVICNEVLANGSLKSSKLK
jgi:hypothetical protein